MDNQSNFSSVNQQIKEFDKDDVEVWLLTLDDPHEGLIDYVKDLPYWERKCNLFQCQYPESRMSLLDICFGQDANEGVDIIMNLQDIREKLGPDSFPAGNTVRPRGPQIERKKDKKKDKKGERKKHRDVPKSKSLAILSEH